MTACLRLRLGVLLSLGLLALGCSPPEKKAQMVLEKYDVDAWHASGPAGDFAGSVLQVMETMSSPDYPRIGLTADAIGMSVRGLQRRLGQIGTSYERLIAQARFGTAVHLLTGTDATVLDIALDLGYSDPAHFTRAFRHFAARAYGVRFDPERARPAVKAAQVLADSLENTISSFVKTIGPS